MKYLVFCIVCFLPFFVFPSTVLEAEIPKDPRELITYYSQFYNVDSDIMVSIIECETAGTWKPDIQSSFVKNGIRENSWGLVQIHLPSHPNIKKEDAINPDFAIKFLAENLSKNKGRMWTCYRLLTKK